MIFLALLPDIMLMKTADFKLLKIIFKTTVTWLSFHAILVFEFTYTLIELFFRRP